MRKKLNEMREMKHKTKRKPKGKQNNLKVNEIVNKKDFEYQFSSKFYSFLIKFCSAFNFVPQLNENFIRSS